MKVGEKGEEVAPTLSQENLGALGLNSIEMVCAGRSATAIKAAEIMQ